MGLFIGLKRKRVQKRFVNFVQGEKVQVVTAPRQYDGADAYAGWEGKLVEKDVDTYFSGKRDVGSMVIEREDGGSLTIIGLSNVKLKHIS